MGKLCIAIDGPAGAGKSTMAKLIAKRLNILYLDTGAMYRTFAYGVIQKGLAADNYEQVLSVIDDININVIHDNGVQRMFLNGIEVSDEIRTPEISKASSDVAVIPEVRMKLVEMQRNIAKQHSIVLDGRDIGTYVLPDATVKFYLEAALEERGLRRWKEVKQKGEHQTLEGITEDIRLRDINDSCRAFAPLSKAVDAISIDTTCKTIEQVSEEMLDYILKVAFVSS